MKAWITPPFADCGIEEIEILGEPNDANLQFRRMPNGYREQSCHWYREGLTWHRTYEAAVDAARKLRCERISKAATEAARVAALPPILQTPMPDHQLDDASPSNGSSPQI